VQAVVNHWVDNLAVRDCAVWTAGPTRGPGSLVDELSTLWGGRRVARLIVEEAEAAGTPKEWFIECVWVEPEYRRRGLAWQMIYTWEAAPGPWAPNVSGFGSWKSTTRLSTPTKRWTSPGFLTATRIRRNDVVTNHSYRNA
jgi:hypothetical protein